MASLKKRGRYYYVKFSKQVDGRTVENVKSLGVRYKKLALEHLERLEKFEDAGAIDPYNKAFDPQVFLQALKEKNEPLQIGTIREAADYFYQKKAHLSNSTVKNPAKRTQDNSGAYERAIEHFISLNDIAELPPALIRRQHFERVIFKPNVKPATRHFYFKQLRVWWNKLLEWEVVDFNFFPDLKKDLPKKKSNIRSKMLTGEELRALFSAFDNDLKRKQTIKEYDDSRTQHWFKPLMSVYFYCGLRKHEAAYHADLEYSGLKGKNLDFRRGKPAMIYLSATKGNNERTIPIPNKCQRFLEEYLGRRGKVNYEEYVFIYEGGRRKGKPVTGAQAYREFKHYLNLARLPDSRTLHGMRHVRVTKWLENGFTPSEAQFMAGHSSVRTTEGYTHLNGHKLLEKQREIEKRKNGDR